MVARLRAARAAPRPGRGRRAVGEALRTLEAEEAKVNAEAHALLGVGIPVLSPRFTASRYANLHWSQTQRGRAWLN